MTGEDQKSQHARFVEKARELGCDESEEAFNEKLKVIARAKPTSTKEHGNRSKQTKGHGKV